MVMKEEDFYERLRQLPKTSHMYDISRSFRGGKVECNDILKNFYLGKRLYDDTSIHVRDVEGEMDGRYAGNRWIDFFFDKKGYKMERNVRELERNGLDYYYDNSPKEHLTYQQINEGLVLYVIEGSHRTHIAKALYELGEYDGWLSGVDLVDNHVDFLMMSAYDDLYYYLTENGLDAPIIHNPNMYFLQSPEDANPISLEIPGGKDNGEMFSSIEEVAEYLHHRNSLKEKLKDKFL